MGHHQRTGRIIKQTITNMKKLLLFGLALGWIMSAKAQVITENAVIIDAAEDTTQVSTINDIIVTQEMVNSRNVTDAHFSNVWSRKSYFNPGFVSSKLSSKDPVFLADGKSQPLKFKSQWGAQIQLGHSYTLHRKAIANMVQINLDFTYIDLTVNHYKLDSIPYKAFNPEQKWDGQPGTPAQQTEGNYNYNGYEYMPWGADKYDLTYGMSLGPSVTVAPFTSLNIKGLHFLKLNLYYHIGYNVGMLLMDEKSQSHSNATGNKDKGKGLSFDYLSWGHGLSTAFGLSLSWKSIGIGWETRTANLKYKPISTGDYGDFSTKMKNSSSRIYLSIKY